MQQQSLIEYYIFSEDLLVLISGWFFGIFILYKEKKQL